MALATLAAASNLAAPFLNLIAAARRLPAFLNAALAIAASHLPHPAALTLKRAGPPPPGHASIAAANAAPAPYKNGFL